MTHMTKCCVFGVRCLTLVSGCLGTHSAVGVELCSCICLGVWTHTHSAVGVEVLCSCIRRWAFGTL